MRFPSHRFSSSSGSPRVSPPDRDQNYLGGGVHAKPGQGMAPSRLIPSIPKWNAVEQHRAVRHSEGHYISLTGTVNMKYVTVCAVVWSYSGCPAKARIPKRSACGWTSLKSHPKGIDRGAFNSPPIPQMLAYNQ